MRKLLLFAIVPAVLAQEEPAAFTGVLCSRFDAQGNAVGVATEFYTDNPILCFRVEAKAAPAEGTRFTPGIAHADGALIGKGDTYVADGKTSLWRNALPIAGMEWAREGGSFRWLLFRNDEEKPLLDLPFRVTAGRRWALLVGINDYPGDDSDLTGCDIDVNNMRVLLEEFFFFPKVQVTIVRDLDATRARIEKELMDLADRAGPTDAVVFYYSGHGTQVPDLDGDEEDGWDEGICPAEPKPKLITNEDDLKLFLTDDRLGELLDRFKTRNVTVIFDCCHSGSGLRAGDDVPTLPVPIDRSRFQRVDVSRALVEKAAEARARGGAPVPPTGLDMGLDAGERWVFITGCRSWEMSHGNDETGGRMTSQLVTAVAGSSGESWDAILGRVSVATNLTSPGQTPTVEGAARRYPFALAEAEGDAPYVRPTFAISGAVETTRSDPVIRLPVGSAGKNDALVAGLSSVAKEQRGIACDVYPQLLVGGAPKGSIELTGDMLVTFVKDENGRPAGQVPFSVARILSGEVAEGDRLLPLATRVPQARPKVGINFADEMRATAVALFKRLQSEPSLEAVDGWKLGDVDYILGPLVADGELLVRVFNRGGAFLAVFRGPEVEVVKEACDFVVARHSQFTRLVRLHNPSAPFRLKVAAEGGEGPRRPGESVVVHVRTGEPAYVYVFAAVGETAAAKPMFESDGALAPTQMLKCTVGTGPKFTGRLFVKVLATKKPLDFKAMQAAPDPAADLLARMREAFPGGADDLLSTDGWADELAWFDFR